MRIPPQPAIDRYLRAVRDRRRAAIQAVPFLLACVAIGALIGWMLLEVVK